MTDHDTLKKLFQDRTGRTEYRPKPAEPDATKHTVWWRGKLPESMR